MEIRLSKPQKGNKYFTRKTNGGYNGAIKGKPTESCDVLANCVGYANGRFAEIIGKNKIEFQLICNAENFIEKAKKYNLSVVQYPTLGGIMVFQKGETLDGKDGAGHVFIVEKIIDKNTIYTSESGYNSKAFWNSTRKNTNGRWGMGNGYKFRGCIINPAIGDVHCEEPIPTPTPEIITYVVKSGDTLSKIAKKYNTNWQKIYNDNKKTIGANPNRIYPGQKLIIK